MADFPRLDARQFHVPWGHAEDNRMAGRQPVVGRKTVRGDSRSVRGRAFPCGNLSRRTASPRAPSPPSQPFFWVYGFLPAPASWAEFLSNEPPSRSDEQHGARLAALGNNFCRASLAESRADSAHFHRRSRHGMAFFSRSQHYSTCCLARYSRHSGLVGVSGRVASRHARGAGFLSLPSAMNGGLTDSNGCRPS